MCPLGKVHHARALRWIVLYPRASLADDPNHHVSTRWKKCTAEAPATTHRNARRMRFTVDSTCASCTTSIPARDCQPSKHQHVHNGDDSEVHSTVIESSCEEGVTEQALRGRGSVVAKEVCPRTLLVCGLTPLLGFLVRECQTTIPLLLVLLLDQTGCELLALQPPAQRHPLATTP